MKQASAAAAVPASPLDWALAYAAEGFAVMPVWPVAEGGEVCACPLGAACTRPAKHPIPKQGVKQATREPERIEAWWEEHPRANLAVATGAVSGLIVIDVDCGSGREGEVSITIATADRGGVPRTLKARSGSGGAHHWYRHRTSPFTRKIGFLRHVDYLSDGGYVIVAPSVNMKGPYTFDAECGVTGPEGVAGLRPQMAELPVWFDELEGRTAARAKPDRAARAAGAQRARMVNGAAMEFSPLNPLWIAEVQRALTFVDPDERDVWVLAGLILGRAFGRNDDGWRVYTEWAARSSKFEDRGTQKLMRGYYYDESLAPPQGGAPATIATLFHWAQAAGWSFPVGGLDVRPVVAYRAGRAMETVETVLQTLAMERESEVDGAQRVYAYGSGLGAVMETHDFGATYTPNGTPPHGWVLRVQPYTAMSLGSRITHSCTMVKFSPTGATSQVECPLEVSSLLVSGDYAKHFPRLNGIVQWPMVGRGRVLGLEGDPYDAAAGLFYALPEGFDATGLTGGAAEAAEAWRWVREEALADFPLAGREGAKALAMMLTFMQRRGMESAPAFLVTAPIQGTGKTTLVRFMSRAVHGRSLGAAVLSGSEEEQRKTITARLLNNPPALLFDNLKAGSSFDSKELAVAITSGEWEDRRLGSTETLTLPNRAVWCFTGNNVTLTNDLRRRFIEVRMVSEVKDHYRQHFSRNIDTWPVDNRERVLRALVSILLHSERSTVKLEGHSGFEEWDRQVRRAVVAVTGMDPWKSEAEAEAEDDDETEAAAAALAVAWAVLVGEERATTGEFLRRVSDAKKSTVAARRNAADAAVSGVAALRGEVEVLLSPLDWGHALKTLQQRPMVVEGQKCMFLRQGKRNGSALWALDGVGGLGGLLDAEF